VEWLRATGHSYREMERQGRGLVVVEALLHYRRPAFFDDELTLNTSLVELGKVSLRFDYEVLRDRECSSQATRATPASTWSAANPSGCRRNCSVSHQISRNKEST
jgi:YbgC/YbaW family acyl-CoA thioester hydrolase